MIERGKLRRASFIFSIIVHRHFTTIRYNKGKGGMIVRFKLLGIIFLSSLLVACNHSAYPEVDKQIDFIASVNIQEPSIDFIDETGKQLAVWPLAEAYSGATLIGDDRILLYGHDLEHADIFQLSTGERVTEIETGEGTTNALYDEVTKLVYLANSWTNTVSAYDENGQERSTQKVGKYPMSMIRYNHQLFVVNFKDTMLSVLDAKTLQKQHEWKIPASSNGLVAVNDELWIGGHGSGSIPNDNVVRLNIKTGDMLKKVKLPMMPIAFLKDNNAIYVLSHGENVLHKLDTDGNEISSKEVGANPFTLASFSGHIIVAGYDDHKIYWTNGTEVERSQTVGTGPFQLLVREK